MKPARQVPVMRVREVIGKRDRLCGVVHIPGQPGEQHILLLRRGQSWTALPAVCPHEGHHLADSPEDAQGHLVCPAHGLQVEAEGAHTFAVSQDETGFAILVPEEDAPGSADPGEIQRLRAELDALRDANASLEQQVGEVTRLMDEMVAEVSTQSRQLEQRSQEQARLTTFVTNVMDTMDSVLLVVDRVGRISQANAAVRRTLGIDPASLIGVSPDSLLSAETLAPLQAASPSFAPGTVLFRTILKAGNLEMETHIQSRLPEAGMRDVMLRASTLYDRSGKLEGVVIVGADITALRAREQALKDSEQLFRDYSAMSSDWYWETDADMRFVSYVGPRRNGLDLNDVVRGKRREDFAPPEDLADTTKWGRYHDAIARREEFRDFEYAIAQFEDGDIKRTTTQIEYSDFLIHAFFIHSIGKCSRSRLVNNSFNF